MCGIFGQCCSSAKPETNKSALEQFSVLVKGLAALQYRGYDSCGVCCVENEKKLCCVRAVGDIKALEKTLEKTELSLQVDSSWCAIGHTRWATHGKVVLHNTHPHVVDGYAVVHNGIVDNADDLRKHLVEKRGVKLVSETDTELIAQLLALQDKSLTLAQRVHKVTKQIRGANAIAVVSIHDRDMLALWRRGSPLAIGFDNSHTQPHFLPISQSVQQFPRKACKSVRFTFASDIHALEPHAERALILADDDIAILHAKSSQFVVFHEGAQPQASIEPLALSTLSCSAGSDVEDDEYDRPAQNALPLQKSRLIKSIHVDPNDGLCMWREIHEQPQSLKRALAGRLRNDDEAPQFGGLSDYWSQIAHAQRFVMIACGTSYYAALAARSLFEQCCGKAVLVERATPLLDREMPIFRGDACFFLSQSGETADVLAALAHCKKAGALCIGIVNSVASSVARLTDCGAYLHCGPEIAVASTKAFTAQISVLALVAARLATTEQRLPILKALQAIPDAVEEALLVSNDWAKHWARQWVGQRRCLVLARGCDEATAYEAALKIKELCYVLAEGCHAGELKHGPLALIEPGLPIIVIGSEDDTLVAQRVRVAMEQVCARGGTPIVVSSSKHYDRTKSRSISTNESNKQKIILPSVHDERLQSIINIVPLQLLAYYWAKECGYNVDRPRNLAKSVTVQ